MQTQKANKTHYSEQEAAQILGVSAEELQSLVRMHIARGDDVQAPATFQASDLVVLRLLARLQPALQ